MKQIITTWCAEIPTKESGVHIEGYARGRWVGEQVEKLLQQTIRDNGAVNVLSVSHDMLNYTLTIVMVCEAHAR